MILKEKIMGTYRLWGQATFYDIISIFYHKNYRNATHTQGRNSRRNLSYHQ